ncbi:FKBP-type peptidyl-prolyl cis-trans isomerase [uncultured Caulobacter sp.]|uniref:FKBP-type peptidyl-prolyl cis-trans isomerase n=1 Tax=uncultured Caulobacter sp. TaxID=158749 RepID=UPI00261AD7EF|nr:FKBP-type peptidyl-prolyl cis-trans isomerase [uncultured Caulobacter sp.]
MRLLASLAAVAVVVAASAASAQQVTPPPQLNAPAPPAAAAGKAFLAKNAKEPGVVTLPSGLQYKVVTAGPKDGPSPKVGDIIKVHYEGKLLDGTVFDSSFQRGKPAIMPLDGLVQAWMETVPKMKVGDEWVLYVPPELGYGAEDNGPIPGGSVMVFRLKLLGMLSAD